MRSSSGSPKRISIWRICALWKPLAGISLSRNARYSRVVSVSITAKCWAAIERIVVMRLRLRVAPESSCSATGSAVNRSRAVVSSRSTSLNHSSWIWWTVMNMTSSLESGRSSLSSPPWRARRSSTRM
jgi:hypothetical protein